jgi:hypothetical protein
MSKQRESTRLGWTQAERTLSALMLSGCQPFPSGSVVGIQTGEHTFMSTATNLVSTDAPNLGSLDPKLASMSYAELDSAIADRAGECKAKLTELVPYLREMRELLSHQGKRSDLRGTPKGLTWQKWVEQKKDLLGSLSTVKRLLRGDLNKKRSENNPELSQLEARLLGTASAGYDLVKAIQQAGNVDAAIQEFLKAAPSPERIEEFIERPAKPTPKIFNLAANLVREVEAYFSAQGNGQTPENLCLALADLKSELSFEHDKGGLKGHNEEGAFNEDRHPSLIAL